MRQANSSRTKQRPISDEPLFLLGTVVITLHALDLLDSHGLKPGPLLLRHSRGDHGDLPASALKANRRAVQIGERVMSAYNIGPSKHDRIWIATDESRCVTSIILPGEDTP
jgi:hypothetical protein